MSMSEILDTSFRVLRNHFALLVGIAASVYVPMSIVGAALARGFDRGPDDVSFPTLIGIVLILITLAGLATTLVFAAITHATAELFLDRPVTWRSALAHAQPRLGRIIATTLLSSLVVLLGFIALIVPGVYLALSFVVLWPVMLIEGRWGTEALRRSRTLIRGHRLRALGLLATVWFLSAVLSTGLALPAAALPRVRDVVSGAVVAVTTVYGAVVAVLLYVDVRCRKEALDVEHLARLVAPDPAGAPPG